MQFFAPIECYVASLLIITSINVEHKSLNENSVRLHHLLLHCQNYNIRAILLTSRKFIISGLMYSPSGLQPWPHH